MKNYTLLTFIQFSKHSFIQPTKQPICLSICYVPKSVQGSRKTLIDKTFYCLYAESNRSQYGFCQSNYCCRIVTLCQNILILILLLPGIYEMWQYVLKSLINQIFHCCYSSLNSCLYVGGSRDFEADEGKKKVRPQ